MSENKLVDLSKGFAVDIINLCTDIKERKKSNVLLNQLLRSAQVSVRTYMKQIMLPAGRIL